MIANERQYKIARQQLVQLRDSLERAEVESTKSRAGSRGLAIVEIAALKSQVESIAAEIHDYEALQSGAVSIPADVGLAELPHLLIRARIARGLSQRDRTSREDDGPIRARNHLAEAGIVLVVEPHLTGTFLDGAALLQRSRPVIGLTLRYDRLDHFWFVLIHELVHVKRHLRNGIVEVVFDDLEADVADDVEREADTQAAEFLIPERVWKKAIARFTRSQTAVTTLVSCK